MAEKKRFYWIKLKENFFDLETIDWLISQKNGCEYIVLYQKLCLLTANKGGNLQMKIGEMLIPYDINKIARDTKFSVDTVIVAMELFKKIGLIYEQENGVLHIPYVAELVGSETPAAIKKRAQREKQKFLKGDNAGDNVLQEIEIEIENREKILDIRDKDVEKEDIKADKPPRTRFKPPTFEEVQSYCFERNNNVDPQRFIDYYTSNGWKVGKNSMKDWKAAVRNWERTSTDKPASKQRDKPETNNPFLNLLLEEGDTF